MPDQFRTSLQGEETVSVEFYQVKYTSQRIDIRSLKALYADLPPFVDIVPPENVDFYSDMRVLIGVPESGIKDGNTMVVWLAANFGTDDITLYTDTDQDRNFRNDNGLHKFRAGPSPRRIVLDPWDEGGKDRVLYLAIPKRQKPGFNRKERQRKIENNLTLSASLGVGTGSLKYNFDNLDTGYPTWYTLDFTERIVRLGVSYDMRLVTVGVDFNYQGMNFYTSYLTSRLGEPFWEQTPQGPYWNKNTIVSQNPDQHSPSKTQIGLYLGGRIPVSRGTELQPFIRTGIVNHKDGTYRPSRYEQEYINLPQAIYWEPGLRAEFVTGLFSTFFIEVSEVRHEWEPVGVMQDINGENYESRVKSFRFGVGFRKGIQF